MRCGAHHTLARSDDGRVFAWGFGGYGRLGNKSPADKHSPVCRRPPLTTHAT